MEKYQHDLMRESVGGDCSKELMDQLLVDLKSLRGVKQEPPKVAEVEVEVRNPEDSEIESKIRSRVVPKILGQNIPLKYKDAAENLLVKRLSASLSKVKEDCPTLDDDSLVGVLLASLVVRQI